MGQRAPQQLRQSQQHLKSITENMENKKMHNTYQFECELFQFVQNGNVNALQNFLKNNTLQLEEGRLAKTPIRMPKIFLS